MQLTQYLISIGKPEIPHSGMPPKWGHTFLRECEKNACCLQSCELVLGIINHILTMKFIKIFLSNKLRKINYFIAKGTEYAHVYVCNTERRCMG